MIAPVYDEMASRYAQKCVLLRTYADKDPDVSASYGVRGYPTFIFIHQRNEVDRMSGADASGLEAKIQSLSERYVRLFMTGPGAGTVGGDEDDEELKELERKWHEERAAQGLPPRKFNPWLLPEYRKKLAQQIKSPTNASASSTDTAAAPAAAGSSSNTTSPPRPSASAAAAGSAAAAPAAASSEKSWPPLSPEAESIRRQLQDNFGFSARSAYAAAQRNKTLEDALTWITDPANENVGPDLSQAAAAPAAAGAGAGAGIGAAAAGASAGAAGKVDSEELNDFALVRSVMKELDGKKRTPGARTSLEDLAAIQKARATGQAPPPRPAAATESAAAPSAEVEHKQPQSATEQVRSLSTCVSLAPGLTRCALCCVDCLRDLLVTRNPTLLGISSAPLPIMVCIWH